MAAEEPAFRATLRYGPLRRVAEFRCKADHYRKGDRCVVRSERGVEVGVVLVPPSPGDVDVGEDGAFEVLRKVTEQDRKKLRVLDREGRTREFAFALERIAAHGLQMKLIKVEHLLGGDRIVFYYTAVGRVDFRQLVKDLAAEFHAKILMRQIGARDEARLLGDYNSCGQELCCTTFIQEFSPVTMKMAKNQMTTLDPTKITGRCGRLMCCLRYEDEHYVELKRQLPRKGDKVRTREGLGSVVGLDVLSQRVTVELRGRRRVPFAAAEVLPVERKSKTSRRTQAPAGQHLLVTAPPLWQGQMPDATAVYSLVAADVIARHRRMLGMNVESPVVIGRYPTGIQRGDDPIGAADVFRARVRDALTRFGIDADPVDTDNRHHVRTVSDFCRRLQKVDDIYKREFAGWQCRECYLTKRDDGAEHVRCYYCGGVLERLEGEFYFFRLARFRRELLASIQTREDPIRPQLKKRELESQIKRGLQDIVIARDSFTRGLPIPSESSFRVAGWFESLLSYISTLIDQDKNARFYAYWPATFQLTSRRGLWTHGVVWLAMLLASQVEAPRHLVVHGDWRGGESDEHIHSLAAELGADAVRYCLFRDPPFGLDGALDAEAFRAAVRDELGPVGDLLSRVLELVAESFGGQVPAPTPGAEPDRRIKELLQEVYFEVTFHFERLQFSLALAKLREAWGRLARYVDEVQPWKMAAGAANRAELGHIVYSLCESLRVLSVFLHPLLPSTAEAMQRALGADADFSSFSAAVKWGGLEAGSQVNPAVSLFRSRRAESIDE